MFHVKRSVGAAPWAARFFGSPAASRGRAAEGGGPYAVFYRGISGYGKSWFSPVTAESSSPGAK